MAPVATKQVVHATMAPQKFCAMSDGYEYMTAILGRSDEAPVTFVSS